MIKNRKNKKGQNSQMAIIGVVLVLLMGSMFAFNSSTGSDDDRGDVSNLAPDTSSPDDDIGDYENRDNENIGDDIVVSSNSNDGSGDTGSYNITYDEENEQIIMTNVFTNNTNNMSFSELESYLGKLNNNEKVISMWFNKNYEVDGFTKYFQAFLIYDESWNYYKIIWSIDNNDFVITKLADKQFEDVSNEYIGLRAGSSNGGAPSYFYFTDAQIDLGVNDSASFYINRGAESDIGNLGEIASLVFISNNNDLYLVTKSQYAGYDPIACSWSSYKRCHYLESVSSNTFKDYTLTKSPPSNSAVVTNNPTYFAVNEVDEYSFPNIALTNPTRTTGFGSITIANQEMSKVDTMAEKQTKILSKERFNEVLNGDVGERVLTNFGKTNVNEIMESFTDSPISIWTDTINHNAYGIGTSNSEDYDNVDGFVIDGYLYNFANGFNAIETKSISFIGDDRKGIQMDDTGKILIAGEELQGESFGRFVMENSNSTIDINGMTYVILSEDGTMWERIYTGLVNMFDYSFDYAFWVTENVDDGRLGLVDVYEECADIGCQYAYSTSFKNSNYKEIEVQSQKPLNAYLKYDNKDYYSFWTLNSRNQEGCLIFDSKAGNLGIRIPTSMCDRKITGTNSFAQISMLSRDADLELVN